MLLEINQIKEHQAEQKAYAISIRDGKIHFLPNKLHRKSEHLTNCLIAFTDNEVMIRCGPIDTKLRALELFRLVQHVLPKGQKNRVASIQLSLPDVEWESIEKQNQLYTALGLPFAHINIALERPFVKKKFKTAAEEKRLQQLSILHNAEGWMHYANWFLEELRDARVYFSTKALDEYVLEARFDDFQREVESTILKGILLDLGEKVKRVCDEIAEPDLVVLEKEILKLRHDLLKYLTRITEVLAQIAKEEKIIEKAHPELQKIHNIASVFHDALKNQTDSPTNQLIQIAKLNHLLDVDTVLNSSKGVIRTSLAFAIMMAKDTSQVESIFKTFCLPFLEPLKREEGSVVSDEWKALVSEQTISMIQKQ